MALTREQVLSVLAEGPPRITAVCEGVADDRLHARPTSEEWSPNEVLAHLRSCADVWGDCIRAILREDRPTLKAVNPRTWIEQTTYRTDDFRPSLVAFTAQRQQLLALLHPLPPEAWERSARVVGAGRPLERSVLSYAQWLATHERPHLKQIARALGR